MAKANPAGESKAPLVVALVFFVLTTLGLAVVVYMDQDNMAAGREAVKVDAAKAIEAGKLRRADQERVLWYREMLGVNSQEESSQLRAMTAPKEVRDEHKKVMQELSDRIAGTPTTPSIVAEAAREVPGTRFDVKQDEVFSWVWPDGAELKDGPKKGLFAVVVSAYAKQLLASQKQATAEKNAVAAAESYQKLAVQYGDAVKTLQDVAKAFPAEVAKDRQAEKARIDAEVAKFGEVTAKFNADLRAKEEAMNNKTIENEQQAAALVSAKRRVDKLDGLLTQREDPFAFEKSLGVITKRADRNVYISLGSADNVRPGLTLTIQPSDTPQRGIDTRKYERPLGNGQKEIAVRTKGTIEVVEVLGPNSSLARITSEPEGVREPITVGDTLYNAAWRRGAAERVALFGVFDVDADGTDDLKAVVKDLSKMGIIVDAYYDIEKKQWVGTITNLTTFAIEGYYPSSGPADGLSGAKADITQRLEAAKRFALEKGVKVVRARDFFPRIGYKMRLDITPDIVNRSYNKYLQVTPAGDAPAAPADAPKN